jgi:hypothetical protein
VDLSDEEGWCHTYLSWGCRQWGRTELFPGDAYSKVTIPGAVTGGCFGWFRTNSLADDRKSCWTVNNYLSMAKLFASEALNSYQSEPNVAKRAQ